MGKFIDMGIEMQRSAHTVRAAKKRFERSCELCCMRGYVYDCEPCPIAAEHKLRLDILGYLKEPAENK